MEAHFRHGDASASSLPVACHTAYRIWSRKRASTRMYHLALVPAFPRRGIHRHFCARPDRLGGVLRGFRIRLFRRRPGGRQFFRSLASDVEYAVCRRHGAGSSRFSRRCAHNGFRPLPAFLSASCCRAIRRDSHVFRPRREENPTCKGNVQSVDRSWARKIVSAANAARRSQRQRRSPPGLSAEK